MAIPERVAVSAPPGSLEVTWSIALWLPAAVGAWTTLMVQLAPGPSVLPQVVALMANWSALVPTTLIPTLASWEPPVLLSVNPNVAELVPVGRLPKSWLSGLSTPLGDGEVAIPERVAVSAPPGSLEVTWSIALWLPAAVGAWTTLMVQLAPGPSVLPQVVALMAN